MGSWSSKHKPFLAFQIFQMMKIGRYSNIPFCVTQLDRFSRRVEAFQSMFTLRIQMSPPITSFRKRQLTNRCSTDSASSASYRQHLLGPLHPFLLKMSQVFIFLLQVRHTKHLIFRGILKYQIFIMMSFSKTVCDLRRWNHKLSWLSPYPSAHQTSIIACPQNVRS